MLGGKIQLALWTAQFMWWGVASGGPGQAPLKCTAQAGAPVVQTYGHTAFGRLLLPGLCLFLAPMRCPIFVSLIYSLMGQMVPILVYSFIQKYRLTLI